MQHIKVLKYRLFLEFVVLSERFLSPCTGVNTLMKVVGVVVPLLKTLTTLYKIHILLCIFVYTQCLKGQTGSC